MFNILGFKDSRIYDTQTKELPHKKHPLLFFLIQKTKKKKRKNVHRAAAAAASSPPANRLYVGNIRGRPPSRSYKRCSRTRRASRSQPCVSSWSSFVVAVVVFLFLGGSLWRTQSALCRKSDDMMAIKIEIMPIYLMTKTTMMDCASIVSPKEARDATSPDHPLSLDERRRKRRKSKVGERTARLESSLAFVPLVGKQGHHCGASFAFVVVESPKREEKSLTFEFRGSPCGSLLCDIFSPPYVVFFFFFFFL